nr:sigma-70 family RNA polymerase sigma factor [Micromonospora sp. DSM 115978]
DVADDEREPTAAEVMAWRRGGVFLPDAEATPEQFPRLTNVSAGFFFDGVVRPVESAPPEFVTLTMSHASGLDLVASVGQWNMLWEAAQFRRHFFDMDELPEPMAAVADLGDVNITFVPRTGSRYFEYAPLLHL